MKCTALFAFTIIFLHTTESAYIAPFLGELDKEENAILEDQYFACPECIEQRVNTDNAKRVNAMRTWARSGMPLSILYLKTKPNVAQQKEEIYPLNSPSLPLQYRSNPSIRGLNSKMYQAASMMKNKPIQVKVRPEALQLQQARGLPMRRQSVVLPQLFVSYGFDSKKPGIFEQK